MELKLVSWNVNGIRAALGHGLMDFIQKVSPEVLCMQETKISSDFIPMELSTSGYKIFVNEAQKKGYSGTMTLSKLSSLNVIKGIGNQKFDAEGRVLTVEYEEFYLVNSYFPNSRRTLERLDYKMEFNKLFLEWAKNMEKKKPLVICGDMNVAHREIDIARPRENVNNAGFTEQERSWMTSFLENGFVDTFRMFHGEPNRYSWWSYMGNARSRNIGWRIDYFIVSESLRGYAKSSDILESVHGSDHAPLILTLEI